MKTKKTMKKVISAVLSTAVVLSQMSAISFAEATDDTMVYTQYAFEYNRDGIYSSTPGYMGGAGYAGSFYYPDFISDKYLTWKTPWTDGMTDNILIYNGVEYSMRVIDRDVQNSAKVVWRNNPTTQWTDFDVDDGKYSTIEMLANSWRNNEHSIFMKLNYSDGTYSYFTQGLTFWVNGGGLDISSTRTNKKEDGTIDESKKAGINHLSIPVNDEKTLVSFSLLNDTYKATPSTETEGEYTFANSYLKDNGDGTTTDTKYTNNTAANAVSVYAITLGKTQSAIRAEYEEVIAAEFAAINSVEQHTYSEMAKLAEIEELISQYTAAGGDVTSIAGYAEYEEAKAIIEGLEPMYAIYDMSGIYNQNNIYQSAMDGGSAGYAGAFYYPDFVSDTYINWTAPWTEGQTVNTLIDGGIEFELKVVDNRYTNESGTVATNAEKVVWRNNAATQWSDFDVKDGRYSTIEMLANSDRAGGHSIFVKLNYSDGTYSYFTQGLTYFTNAGSLSVSAPRKNPFDGKNANKGGINHLSIPVDYNKTLVNFQVLNDTYKVIADETTEDGYTFEHTYEKVNKDGTTTPDTKHDRGSSMNGVTIYALTLGKTKAAVLEDYAIQLEEEFANMYSKYELGECSYADMTEIERIEKLIADYEATGGYASDISGYWEYLTAKETIEWLEPAYMQYDMTDKYNVGNIYTGESTDGGGSAGYSGTWYYNDFISDTYIDWKKPWTEGMIDNTLTLNGIDYDLRVVDRKVDANASCVWRNDTSKTKTDWVDFDVTDAKYTSLEMLVNTEQASNPTRSVVVKLNYFDEDAQEWIYGYYKTNVSKFSTDKKYLTDGIGSTRAHGTTVPLPTGSLSHISVPVDYRYTLRSFSILNDKYDVNLETGEVDDTTYAEMSRYGGLPHAIQLYAVTLGMPKAEAASIISQGEAYMPVNMDRYYNKANIFTDDETKTGCFQWGASVYVDKFKAKDYWVAPWVAGMEKNTLSYTSTSDAQADYLGTKFTLKVTDFAEDSLSNTFMSNAATTEQWNNIDVEDANYSAVRFLAAAGGNPKAIYVKLNYSTGEPGYYATSEIGMGGNLGTNLPVPYFNDSGKDKTGGMITANVPADPERTLVSVDVLNYGMTLDTETGEVTGTAGTTGYAINIFAVTGVTTVGTLNDILNAKTEALKNKTLTWEDYQEIGAIEELIPFAQTFDKQKDFEEIKASVIPVDNTINMEVTMTEGDGIEDAIEKIIAFGKNYHATDVITFNINIPDGTFELSDTIKVDGAKFPYININISGGNNTIFTTAKTISNSKISDNVPAAVKNRLPVEARDKVVAISVDGLSSLKEIWNYEYLGARLYVDGKQQSMARYPDEGYVWVTAEDLNDDKTRAVNPDFEGWMTGDEAVWMESYLGNKYATVRFYPAYIDANDTTIRFEKNKTDEDGNAVKDDDGNNVKELVTIKAEDRYSVSNIPEALNKPGEYYVDKNNNVIYYYPTTDIANAEVSVDLGKSNAMDILNSVNVTVKNIIFKNINEIALKINKAENIVVEDCSFKNVGLGIINREYNTANMLIQNNYFNNVGGKSVIVTGGDIATLEPSGNKVTNNLFEDISTYVKTYAAAIDLKGVGNEASFNTIRKSTSNAIVFSGSKNLITKNKIFDVCRETSDAGAIYSGRDMTFLGNEISYNHIENVDAVDSRLHGKSPNMRAGIYLDDRLGGTIVHHNYVKNTDRGIHAGGGSFNQIYDNVLEDCVEYPVRIGGIGAALQITDPEAANYDTLTATALTFFEAYPVYNTEFTYTATQGTAYNCNPHDNLVASNVYNTDPVDANAIQTGALTADSTDSTKGDIAAALTEKGITPELYGAQIEAEQTISIVYPLNNTVEIDNVGTLFKWTSVPKSTNYRVEFADTDDFTAAVKTVETRNTYAEISDIPVEAKYWRVVAETADGDVASAANEFEIRYEHSVKSVILKNADGTLVKDLAQANTIKVTLNKNTDENSKLYAGFYQNGKLVKCIELTNAEARELSGVENSDTLSIFVFDANMKPLSVNNIAID